MTAGVVCGAESTVVHTVFARPIVGALICVAAGGIGGFTMLGEADKFGGCGTVGGDLMIVTEDLSGPKVCAAPHAGDPTLKVPD